MKSVVRAFLLALFAMLSWIAVAAAPVTDIRQIRIAAGKSADLWLGINVSGNVYYAIRTRDGSNSMRMWWVMEPLGNVKQLGVLRDRGTLSIPGALNASVSAKLRGSNSVDTIVFISEKVAIANSVTFHW